jgi:hypothetical protein
MHVSRHVPVIATVVLLHISSTQLGHAHEAASGWSYPWECCSSTDCWETSSKTERDPVPTAAGWQLQDGSVVPFNMTRQSPDGAFHVCRRGGQLTGAVIRPSNSPVCLWVPSSS